MTTLILSGWTQPTDALAHLVDDPVLFDYSDFASPEAALVALKQVRCTRCVAWSMGGHLALKAIAAGALRLRHLTLIATPYQFVSDDPALRGMDSRTFELFRASYANDAARTSERFKALLVKGDRDARRVMPLLAHHPQVRNTARFLPWLDDLGRSTLADTALTQVPPTLLIHGTHDAIVPHDQSRMLARILPQATLSSWAEVGHTPHLHDAVRLRREIAEHQALHERAA